LPSKERTIVIVDKREKSIERVEQMTLTQNQRALRDIDNALMNAPPTAWYAIYL
jgi:hypothetical protein